MGHVYVVQGGTGRLAATGWRTKLPAWPVPRPSSGCQPAAIKQLPPTSIYFPAGDMDEDEQNDLADKLAASLLADDRYRAKQANVQAAVSWLAGRWKGEDGSRGSGSGVDGGGLDGGWFATLPMWCCSRLLPTIRLYFPGWKLTPRTHRPTLPHRSTLIQITIWQLPSLRGRSCAAAAAATRCPAPRLWRRSWRARRQP